MWFFLCILARNILKTVIDNLDVPNDPTPHETDNADTVEVTPDEIDDDEANSIETADDYENNGLTPQETTGADQNADKTRVTDHNDGIQR